MNEKLLECLQGRKTVMAMFANARERALGNIHDRFVRKLECPLSGKRLSRDTLASYFDQVHDQLQDSAILALVSCFERIAFEWMKTATGEFRNLLADGYSESDAYGRVAPYFVRTPSDVNNLGGLLDSLEGVMSEDMHARLGRIVKYRNYISHGKRWERPEMESFGLDGLASFLDEILCEIKLSERV